MIGKVVVLLSFGGDHVEAIKSANQLGQPLSGVSTNIKGVAYLIGDDASERCQNVGGVSLSLRIWQTGFPPGPGGHFSNRLITQNIFVPLSTPARGSLGPAARECNGSSAFAIPLTFSLVPGVATSETPARDPSNS